MLILFAIFYAVKSCYPYRGMFRKERLFNAKILPVSKSFISLLTDYD
jgi:hypothetical protein